MAQTMKAIQKAKAGPGAKLISAPVPKPTSHQVLVRVKATSICGTDIHIYNWDAWSAGRIKPPMIFGHEFAGEVVEVGAQVEHIKVGDHVSAETHIPCRGCYQCRTGQMHICKNVKILGVDCDGCFAEYVAVPEICCIRNDKSLPWEIATVQEPFGNATYTVSESNVSGKSVAILGNGPIGIFAVGIARAYGATNIIVCGKHKFRLDLVRTYGADHVIDVAKQDAREAIMDITKGEGVDVVLEMSGSERAIHDGLASVKRGGTFTAFGIPSKPIQLELAEEVVFKGIRILAINGRKMFETWYEVGNLLRSGRVDVKPVITHEFPLEKIDDAMAMLTAKEKKAGKIVLKP
ncbi:MAG: L-threonine 3-dehydrogenase [Pseudomonadota bacterium]